MFCSADRATSSKRREQAGLGLSRQLWTGRLESIDPRKNRPQDRPGANDCKDR
jgi:hypothetical protein